MHFPGCVAQAGDWQVKFDPQTNDEQFEALLHELPFPQLGEQAGGWHTPFAHRFDPQSPLAPHGFPWLHLLGVFAHEGAPHFPAVQTNDEQSVFWVQGAPFPQLGEQEGAAHFPPVQSPDAQSAFDPQFAPVPQLGAQTGGWQTPLVQIPDWQSAFPVQGLPEVQLGEQADQLTQVAW